MRFKALHDNIQGVGKDILLFRRVNVAHCFVLQTYNETPLLPSVYLWLNPKHLELLPNLAGRYISFQ